MDFLKRRDGLHGKVPFEEYAARSLEVVSKTGLVEVARSPMHFRAWAEGIEDTATPALVFGKAFHCAVFEPELFERVYVCAPDFGDCRYKDNKTRRDAWRAENAGKAELSAQDLAAIRGMAQALHAHRLGGRMFQDGVAELSGLWTDPETGLRCKLRTDYYLEDIGWVIDLKSTGDASKASFKRDIFRYSYHWQDALYREGLARCGANVKRFLFVAVEKNHPHGVGVFTLDDVGVSSANRSVREVIARQAQCVRDNRWPGYTDEIQEIASPPWAA